MLVVNSLESCTNGNIFALYLAQYYLSYIEYIQRKLSSFQLFTPPLHSVMLYNTCFLIHTPCIVTYNTVYPQTKVNWCRHVSIQTSLKSCCDKHLWGDFVNSSVRENMQKTLGTTNFNLHHIYFISLCILTESSQNIIMHKLGMPSTKLQA